MAADGLKEGITQAAKDQAINDAKALVIAVDEVKAVAKVVGVTQAAKDQAINDAKALVVADPAVEGTSVTQAVKDQAISDANALVIAVDEVKAVAKVVGVTQAAKDQAISDANALVVGLTKADIANAKTAAQARLDTAKIALEKFPAKDITL